jgi:hypothetical protein
VGVTAAAAAGTRAGEAVCCCSSIYVIRSCLAELMHSGYWVQPLFCFSCRHHWCTSSFVRRFKRLKPSHKGTRYRIPLTSLRQTSHLYTTRIPVRPSLINCIIVLATPRGEPSLEGYHVTLTVRAILIPLGIICNSCCAAAAGYIMKFWRDHLLPQDRLKDTRVAVWAPAAARAAAALLT